MGSTKSRLNLLLSYEMTNVSTTSISPQNIPFLQHIRHCHNIKLPAGRSPLYYQREIIGWVDPAVMPILTGLLPPNLLTTTSRHIILHNGQALRDLSYALASHNYFHAFHEWFDVKTSQGYVIGQIDRGLIPIFGIEAAGVHLNGLVKKNDELFLWIAKRSPHKRLDPGKLDHLVAGGISSGLSPDETIIKEAGEEATITPDIAAQAHHVSTLRYAMLRPEGLRRDCVYCYDLLLPEDFVPRAADGEVESFYLKPLHEVFLSVRDHHHFKFNVNLVLIDLFIRHNVFSDTDTKILKQHLYMPPSSIQE